MTPGPIPQPAGSGPTTADRLGPDPTRWQIWWELNKDRYTRRLPGTRADGASGRPVTDEQRRKTILPALQRALAGGRNRDVVTAVMIAFGKIGIDGPDLGILPLIQKQLRRGDQEIRETAALAMGMLGQKAAFEPLIGLLHDSPAGRRLLGRSADDRTRAFAAYGLGLLASASDVDVKRAVFDAVRAVFEDRRENSRDVLIAAVNAVRQLGVDPTAGGKDKRLLWSALEALHALQTRKVGNTLQTVQAHVPTTIARLLGRGTGPDHERFKEYYASLLRTRGSATEVFRQSAVLALGELAVPGEAHEPDAARSDERYAESLELTGYLCVGLALLDDRSATDRIAAVLSASRRRPQVVTQAAMALARLGDRRAVDVLHGLLGERDPYATVTLASTANALGQLGDARSVDPLIAMMNASSQTKLLRAFAAVAVGMVADDDRLPWNARIAEGINYRALVETLSDGSSGILDIL